MNRHFIALLLALLLPLCFSACAEGSAPAEPDPAAAPAWAAYNSSDKCLGVIPGGLMEEVAHKYFPDSEYLYLSSYPDCIAALLAGKIDAYLGDEPGLRAVHAEQPAIDYIRPRITDQDYSFAFRKNDPKSAALCRELNAFLAVCRQDDTLKELEEIWFGSDESRKTVDMSDLTDIRGTIRVVTTSTDIPFSYIKDGKNVGYDIDLVARFCRYAGYALELDDVDFAARIPAIESGKYDFSTDMNVTPERSEQVLFSDPTSTGGVVLAVLAGEDPAEQTAHSGAHTSIANLDGARIGVQTGSTFDAIVLESLPHAKFTYFNSYPDMVTALMANKIDAFPGDEPVIRLITAENSRLTMLEDRLDSFEFGVALSKTEAGDKLRGEFNAWLAEIKASGELEAITKKWTDGPESEKTILDYNALPAPNGTLRMATEGAYAPMNYFRGDNIVGMEVDLAARFCEAKGYGLVIESMNFDGLLSAVQSGKADFAAAGISITKERAESVYFTDPYYKGGTVMAVLKDTEPAGVGGSYHTLNDLEHKVLGIPSGTNFDLLVSRRYPNAKLVYYPTQSDLLAALAAGKIDAFPSDEPVIRYIMGERDDITFIPEFLDTYDTAYCFAKDEKGEKLRAEFSEFLDQLRANGRLDALIEEWFSHDEGKKTLPDYTSFPAENGTLVMGTDGNYVPFEYYRDGALVGYDIDIAALFCQEYGYGLRINVMNLDALLPALQSGNCDFVGSALTVTPERAESVLFSSPNYTGGAVMVVRAQQGQQERMHFLGSVYESFGKTFLREKRWVLFLQGIMVTLIITLLSALAGTMLGFAVFIACRGGNELANGITKAATWLVQGTPMVVLLMILYYVIFAHVAMGGTFRKSCFLFMREPCKAPSLLEFPYNASENSQPSAEGIETGPGKKEGIVNKPP